MSMPHNSYGMSSHDGWIPIRKRTEYIKNKDLVNEAIAEYYVLECDAKACDDICLKAFRLLKYLRQAMEEDNILDPNHILDERNITDVDDAIVNFYCMTEDHRTSHVQETDIMENLSRSAYRRFKGTDKGKTCLDCNKEIYIGAKHCTECGVVL